MLQLFMSDQANFNDILNAARNEEWDFINKHLPSFANDESVANWAKYHLLTVEESNDQLRHLAANILEVSVIPVDDTTKAKLREVMEKDTSVCAQYRAAFALFVHGDQSSEIIAKIKEATEDEDVKDIAKGYLKQVKMNV